MTTYAAPLRDMEFVLRELADLQRVAALPGFSEATPDLVEAVLAEAARLAGEVLAPANKLGDLEGTRVIDNGVRVPEVLRKAYATFVEGGWPGLKFSPDYGGQGLPVVVSTAVEEMWQSSNMAFALCPLLTQGAIDAIQFHGNEAQKQDYLSHMVTGTWTGTMNLTEPQAGSDLAAVRTRAEPQGDHYLLSGQKIFITWGDHDAAENIIHLVLARTPDAPPGVKGISLFIVPKFMVNADGSLGDRNDVYPVSVEHKLGIHASPTCVMSFGDHGGAKGFLVGEENQGLVYMFTMMNRARLSVGLQGLAISERAYQQAVGYARDRVQGAVPGHEGRVSIVHHADVRRMLMLMRSQIEAMRALCYSTMSALDFADHGEDPALRQAMQTRVDLLTPVVKGWCTEVAQELTSLGVQVHGGMGYIEETGASQHFRDARITTIYEGTTGIQAMDLVGRKTLRDHGAGHKALLADIESTLTELERADESLAMLRQALAEGVQAQESALEWLLTEGGRNPDVAGGAAFNFLMLMGCVTGGWQMARGALAATRLLAAGEGESEYLRGRLATARFYATHVLPRAQSYLRAVTAGAEEVMTLPEEQF
jgi:acyl-CoA dehydrogenase